MVRIIIPLEKEKKGEYMREICWEKTLKFQLTYRRGASYSRTYRITYAMVHVLCVEIAYTKRIRGARPSFQMIRDVLRYL